MKKKVRTYLPDDGIKSHLVSVGTLIFSVIFFMPAQTYPKKNVSSPNIFFNKFLLFYNQRFILSLLLFVFYLFFFYKFLVVTSLNFYL